MLTSELFEKRSNPDQNKKQPALVALEKYRGRKDIFVSFTSDVGVASRTEKDHDIKGDSVVDSGNAASGKAKNSSGFKIGINPRNEFNTPTGVYTYPIDYVLEKKLKVPFGHSRPFIMVVRINTTRILEIDEASEADLEHVLNILQTKYDEGREELEMYIEGSKLKTPGSALWYTTMLVARNQGDDKIDDEFERLHPHAFPEKPLPEEGEAAMAMWQAQVREIYRVRHNAKSAYLKNINVGGKRGALWNRILRDCGYECIIDDGAGIIHPNEPNQAVFLTGTSLKLVEVINNTKNMDYRASAYLSDNPTLAIREIIRGNMRFEDIARVITYTPSIFPEVINYLRKDDAVKLLKDNPDLFQKKLPAWTHDIYADLPESFDNHLSQNIEREAILKRIRKRPSFWKHAGGSYNNLRFENLDPLTQRIVAKNYPRELTMVDNYSLIDKDAFRIAMSLLDAPQRDYVTKWAAK